MKTLLLSCIAATLSLFSLAQMKEGKIVYQMKAHLKVSFVLGDSSLANQFAKTQQASYELLFANNQCLLQKLPDLSEEDNPVGESANGLKVIKSVSSSGDITFMDLTSGKKLTSTELNLKKFIVEDTLPKMKWKITQETKTLLGHVVTKALSESYSKRAQMTMENGEFITRTVIDTIPVVAWFASDIPVSAGPVFAGELPGMILQVDMGNGRTVYTAVEITPKVSVSSIKEPRGGKRISANDFQLEIQKSIEERQKMLKANNYQMRVETKQ